MSLSESDLAAMREIAYPSTTGDAGWRDGVGLPLAVLQALKRLVPCDEVCVVGVDWKVLGHYLNDYIHDDDSSIGRFVSGEPIPYDGVGPEHGFWGTFWSDVCSYPERTGDYRSVTRLSDFLSDVQLRARRGYAENARPRGFLRETMVVWPDGHGRTLRVLFWRGPGQDFGERERFILELLRPHLIAAYEAPARQQDAAANLTAHQRAILRFVSEGYTNGQIARRMNLAEGTVHTHLNRIYKRLDVNSRTAAVQAITRSLER
jgi:DNA-binding CsgD family transcriptional regulator